ncbi:MULTISPECIES: ABC transporter ATP-binding protein [Streptomyces]|uniref:ABC transporter ATP-binding protein n=1 Tax=Streptomyces TaxID=1883 RepID=UPI000A3A0CE8|nr:MULTISPECIES: ATP-binding cassette domain-containing protein [Streptomyces]NNG86952.1 ATP-binding cassette domain-containing protein [Streptomyces cacaoi]QHF94898.1 ABC transporter ATP-binding protein [Streptomyces sp. NHF165]
MSDQEPVPALHVRGLARSYRLPSGPVHAVRGLDLTVPRGEILGFLGPNGAGKTTTQRMLATLLPPTAGQARVAGRDLVRDPAGVRARIGYVAQAGGLDPGCGVREELVTQGRLHRMPRAAARARAGELAAELGLTALLDRPTGALSGGQRRRVEIALGLVNRPEVLFLDEPTTGLDPGSRAGLWELIRRIRRDLGTTVFLTTHYLDEADALCDRVVVIDGGRAVAEGSPAQLRSRYAPADSAGTLQDAFLALTGRGPTEKPLAV